jgi:acid phosphatase
VVLVIIATACAAPSSTKASPPRTPSAGIGSATRPTASRVSPAPVVLIVMENHSYGQIAGSASAPYLNRFAHRGRCSPT